MIIKKKSKVIKSLEKITGRELSFGGLIESIRLGEELTLNEFSKKLKISVSHLCDIEKGRKAVSPIRAASFAKILKRSESQFVRLALQDELKRSGLDYNIKLEAA